jgi:hypothetical protein
MIEELKFDALGNVFNMGFDDVTTIHGKDGVDGKDGISPVAKVEETTEGATITITDANGTTTASVKNGTNGADGKDGVNGKDGYTPIKGVDYYTDAEKTELVNEISNTVTGDIETALDNIIAIQNNLMGVSE